MCKDHRQFKQAEMAQKEGKDSQGYVMRKGFSLLWNLYLFMTAADRV